MSHLANIKKRSGFKFKYIYWVEHYAVSIYSTVSIQNRDQTTEPMPMKTNETERENTEQ